jgi:hypothetical protein
LDAKRSGAAEVMLVRLQHGKGSFTHSLHVRPTTCSLSGWQTPDLLGQLGFAHGNGNFVLGGHCYSRAVGANFDTHPSVVATFCQACEFAWSSLGFRSKSVRDNAAEDIAFLSVCRPDRRAF